MRQDGWKVWIDTGGTFTDALAVDPQGRRHRAKVLSTASLRGVVEERLGPDRLRARERWGAAPDLVRGFRFRLLNRDHSEVRVAGHDPSSGVMRLAAEVPVITAGDPFEVVSPDEAPVLATRLLTGTQGTQPLPVESLRLATTLGTNALLERRGARIALFITKGFGDLPTIGNQQRPDLFALDIRKPQPLYETVVEVPERVGADGTVLVPLDVDALVSRVHELRDDGIDAAAVALMHGYRYPEHEREVERALLDAGFRHVSRSSELAPFIRLVPRAATCVVDGYLAPILRGYLERVRATLGEGHLHVMTSAGGLVGPESFRPKESLLSGPAGGVVGAALSGRRAGFDRVIAFDMGGTSTDVSRVDGDFEYVFEHEVGDAHLVAPALAIETVAAGGGSICRFDGQRLRVGPESAGARPGPACYASGGPLTLTDVNLLLGRLNPDRFGIPIDTRAAAERVTELIPSPKATCSRACSTSPTNGWPMPSDASRCGAATTRRPTRWSHSAAPARSTPAPSPVVWGSPPSLFHRTPVF
jgi:5-oxoprolinase (ATP-hydrolysing)